MVPFTSGSRVATEFLDWVIRREVKKSSYEHLFGNDSFALPMFQVLFFGDLGTRYLKTFVDPFVEKVESLHQKLNRDFDVGNCSTDIQLEKNETHYNEDREILLLLLQELLDELMNSPALCPMFVF